MPSEMETTFLVVAIGEFVIGMLGKGFIVPVNSRDWVKCKKLSLADCILTGLAISRIGHLSIIVLDAFVMVLWPHVYGDDKLATCMAIAWTLNNHLATWSATCLSVFYFFKIANFSQLCFVWLKQRISTVLLVLPLGSLSFLMAHLALTDKFSGCWNVCDTYLRNSTWLSGVRLLCTKSLVADSLIQLIPFLLSVISLLLLFLSLMRHTRKLELISRPRDPSTVAHKRAMKMITLFLLLFMVHFSSSVLTGWTFHVSQKIQDGFAVTLAVTLFPSGHSFILILGNRKLHQAALQLLRHLKCHLKRVKTLAS
ncbi:PREDICTED: taste receptor type 2 member 42-like [Condylura cristata]|uniref:taste receptor type 2 member 42-like n=1 Tax=Condylura cristata TaxID=143302 RepID=UPI0003344FFD|nr:PREDICTED: taste receptor type 2 member 42-like [Condylura cristata]